MSPADLPFSAAADRNKAPVLEQLQRLLPPTARVLEIASGTGQHAQHFAQAQPGWVWQPTDTTDDARHAIDARCAGLSNVQPAVRLDVLEAAWPSGPYDAIYCANMLHISPWATCPALMRGAAAHLAPGGLLLLYGPYRVDGTPTAPSNEAFDADLKARNPAWGLRALSDVEREAASVGLVLQEVVTMPANNLLLVLRRAA
jgi:cyclopropane fatty-acyl-phospholipid synthase-like methyltransferase